MVFAISCVFTRNILDRWEIFFMGLMFDESTNVSVTEHLVIFAIYLESSLSITCFFGVLYI